MSKKSKKKTKEKNQKAKRARKDAQRALYESFKNQGINTKSKRARKTSKSKRKMVDGINHPNGACGNQGCIKCHGVHMKPFLRKGKPHRMPHWMYKLWLVHGDNIKGDMLLQLQKAA